MESIGEQCFLESKIVSRICEINYMSSEVHLTGIADYIYSTGLVGHSSLCIRSFVNALPRGIVRINRLLNGDVLDEF